MNRCARIEITRPGTDDRCVLVSKAELDSLERAIEILSDSEEFLDISQKLSRLAAVATSGEFAQV